jgi:hypothetical protein
MFATNFSAASILTENLDRFASPKAYHRTHPKASAGRSSSYIYGTFRPASAYLFMVIVNFRSFPASSL